jgi:CHAT domain-containing protein
LEFCEQRKPIEAVNYGIAENATEDLPCTIFEADKIAKIYNIPDALRLRGRRQAQVQSYRNLAKQVQVLHSSHHAQCCIYNPLESQLILGDGRITLGELLSPGWRLPNLSDVFLSCCETNLGSTKTTDDILTLGTGFLCAGARSVVSTQWAVNDLATALFSIFYYEDRQQGETRPEALRKAQVKLRTLTGKTLTSQYRDELELYLKQQFKQANDALKQAKAQQNQEEYELWDKVGKRIFDTKESLKQLCKLELPFASSYYWAGFICQGMR